MFMDVNKSNFSFTEREREVVCSHVLQLCSIAQQTFLSPPGSCGGALS